MGPRMREGVEGREYPAARFFGGLGMPCGVRWGNGRFPNRPYGGGLVAQHITGDHKGRPYGGRMAGWGKGNGSPHAPRAMGGEGVPSGEILRGTRNDMWGALGERAVREPPVRGVGLRGGRP